MFLKNAIDVYTDGSCLVQERIGGWAVVSEDFVAYGRRLNTTNNEMELYAILQGISHAINHYDEINIYSDSEYAIRTLTEWAYKWKRNGWMKKGGIKNLNLIKQIFELVEDNPKVKFHKVKSHSGIEMNERADTLAYNIMKGL